MPNLVRIDPNLATPAKNLRELLTIFAPQPLIGKQLDSFYVDRGSPARSRMKTLLEQQLISGDTVRLLFTGHRGAGKSTELNKLCEEIGDKFFTVKVSTSKIIQPIDLSYVDIILIAAAALYKEAIVRDVFKRSPTKAAEDILKSIRDFFRERVFGGEVRLPKSSEAGVSVEVNALIAKFEASYKNEAPTRDRVRQSVEDHLSDVIEQINLLCKHVEETIHKPVLFAFDDTDKPDTARAEKIFFDHPSALTSFAAAAIFSFPIDVWYSKRFGAFKDHFTGTYRLPNISIRKQNGDDNPDAQDIMCEMLTRRAVPKLFEKDALDLIVSQSGGLTRHLISLARFAVVDAIGRGAKTIDRTVAERAVEEIRKDFIAALETKDYLLLAQRHADKRLSSDADIQNLLYSLALLEYENGETWCDVHPIALPLVEERAKP